MMPTGIDGMVEVAAVALLDTRTFSAMTATVRWAKWFVFMGFVGNDWEIMDIGQTHWPRKRA
jgi:hypothetical protein